MSQSVQSKMATIDFRSRGCEGIEKLARIQVERELDLKIFYAVGDETGPFANEVSLGVSSRRSFAGAIETAQRWRSEKLVVHFQHVIRGEAALLRLKSLVEAGLRKNDLHKRGSWWCVEGAMLANAVHRWGEIENIPLLTEADAAELEQRSLCALMDRVSGV